MINYYCLFVRYCTSHQCKQVKYYKKLKIWVKAQRESVRCPKSDWGKFKGVKFPQKQSHMARTHKCISIRKTRTIDLGWVNISRVISGVSGPNFTNFFLFNAVLIVLVAFYRLSISLFVLEIFAVKLESCCKTY